MGFNDLLRMMIEKDGSDLFLTAGAPPSMKAQGKLIPLIDKQLPEGMVKKIAYQIMSDDQIKEFEQSPEMNLAVADPDIGRFRVNIFQQRGEIGIVARNIKTEIPSAESLGLPPVLSELIMNKRGIILFVGGTGSGKSTSLAALIDHRNKNSDSHIVTIEDPVEFVHPHRGCIVNQREVGVDTNSYEEALKNTLRQAQTSSLLVRFAVRRLWSMPWPSQKLATSVYPRSTPTTQIRHWIESSTFSLKNATNSSFWIYHLTWWLSYPSAWSRP